MDNTLPLPDIFHKRIFRVPDYQRGYAWEEEQVDEFLDDLQFLGARHHYTGTVVLCKVPDALPQRGADGTNYVETYIVDGQQRLTTIVLLLSELGRALEAYPDCADLALGIRNNYVQTKSRDNWPIYKLSLNKDTHAFYRDSVLPETPSIDQPPVGAAARLRNAKKQIADYLRREDDELESEHKESLTEWHAKLTQQLHFNLYEVEKEAEVGIIFEVMNDRGKPLTELEKVKNYLLYAASSLDVDEFAQDGLANSVNDAWTKILSNLMTAGLSDHEDQLLQMHWIMQYEPQARNWYGVKSVKGKFGLRKYAERHNDLLVDLRKYVEGLRDSSIAYCDARKPNRSEAFGVFHESARSDLRRWNSKLVRTGSVIRPFLPLLMAVQDCWPSDQEKYLEALKFCEKFAFRTYRVGRANSNFREAAMFRLAHNVAARRLGFGDAVREMKRAYGEGWVRRAFDAFTNAAGPSADYGYSWGGLKYFLYEYEEHLATEKGVSPNITWQEVARDGPKGTIEHVLPQYIGDQPYWQDRFTASEHKEYVHDIGNLALTKWNSHYGNKPFPEKRGAFGSGRKCYAEAPFYQEREIAPEDDWTKESIDARRAKLNAWAKERWRVDFSDVDGAGAEDVEPDEDEMDDEADIEDEDEADKQG